jgi:hypothetical protein
MMKNTTQISDRDRKLGHNPEDGHLEVHRLKDRLIFELQTNGATADASSSLLSEFRDSTSRFIPCCFAIYRFLGAILQ